MTQENMVATPDEQTLEEQMNEQAGAGNLAEESADAEESTVEVAPSEADIITQLQAEVAAEKARADELLDKLQRTAADFQNSRRRQERQLSEELERASTRIIKHLLPVIDDFQLAFQNLPSEVENGASGWVDGFRQIQKKMTTLLEDEGITPIAPDGEFDPNRHEAVTSEPNESVPSGHIIDTLRTGYELKGRVLRPALVRVAL